MTDRDAMVRKISAAMSEGTDTGGYVTLFDMLSHIALKVIEENNPQSLSGCLHPGNEPKSCQYEGQCLSVACNHNGKTWYVPRMTLEPQMVGILYPPKETT